MFFLTYIGEQPIEFLEKNVVRTLGVVCITLCNRTSMELSRPKLRVIRFCRMMVVTREYRTKSGCYTKATAQNVFHV